MINCKSKYIDRFECEYCEFKHNNPNIKRNCPKFQLEPIIGENRCYKKEEQKPTQPPNLGRKLWNFSRAALSHWVAGSPTCTQEQINERLEICKTCPYFRKYQDEPLWGICGHESCGCNITAAQIYFNKLGWADQSCPIDKWGPVVPSGV